MYRHLRCGTALGLLFCASPLVAQSSTPEPGLGAPPASVQPNAADPADGVQDIVVTAQRREESAQRAALSIEVLSGDALSRRGISRPDDLTKAVTGVQVGGGSTTQIYIRGVGNFGVIATANPAVVTSLNGVAISRPQAISGNFFDLERVEVLKGPQGTLYGRNASGGAVNLLAARPRLGSDEAYLEGSFGNYSAKTGEGFVNLAAGDQAAFRLSFQLSDRDGYLTDGGDDDKHQSVRAQALVKLTDRLTARLQAGYIHLGGEGSGLAVIPSIPGQSAWTGTTSTAAADYYIQRAASNFAASGGTSVPPALLARPDSFRLFQNIRNWNVDGEVNYDFGGPTLTILPGYRRVTAKFGIQPGFNYSPGSDGTDGETSNQYSVEARLGQSTGKLKWVIGALGFKEDQTTDFAVNSGLVQHVRIASDLGTRALAAFGEATYSLTDRFRVIGGARYTSDRRSQTNFRKFAISPTVTGQPPLPAPCVPPAFAPGTQCSVLAPGSYDSSKTFNKATWKGGVEFDLAPQNLLFATVSSGFKAGGFNQAIDPVNTSQTLAFAPEKITAYTLGSRNRFLANRLQVNLEGFYWDYRNLQLSGLILDGSGNVSLTTQNAGKARIWGGNVEVVARPLRGTTLRASLEYANSRYRSFSYVQAASFTSPGSTGCTVTPSTLPPGPAGPFVTIDCTGRSLARTPRWSGQFGLTQRLPLAHGDDLTFYTDVAVASRRYTSTSYVANSLVDGYANWSATLTYNAPGDRWFVGGYVRNITNARVYTGGGGDQSPFVTGFVSSTIGAPRTYGARAGIHF